MRRFLKFIVRTIPRPILIRLGASFSFLFAFLYRGEKYECPICGGRFKKMFPWGNKGKPNRLCPQCLSLERHRLLWLYLKNRTGFFSEKLKALHIAPEQPFLKRFKALKNLDYITADLVSPIADVKMDIQDIPFKDNTFDVVMCNHVMEHIPDESKAIMEVFRVLKKGGWAILQVPVDFSKQETYEDAAITDPKEREKHFGQYDHLRFHGLDYPKRLEAGGFTVIHEKYLYEFDEKTRDYYRLPCEEVIYLCKKGGS
ncbi:MAG: methyltransferase domain-containing protein [Bacteroidia bacterium]|nr:methyltransferase domain-containing protein [Bacteroidia bacterium]